MNENENLVTEEVAENVEQTTEETPKTYTEEEFNAKLNEGFSKKIARREAKIRKEYDREYGELVDVLRAGTGKESVGELTDTFREFYQKKGITVRPKPSYSERDIEVLAKAEADDIIRGGFDEVVEEVDRLAQLGVSKMTDKEKAVFRTLATHRAKTERNRELAEIGVGEDVYESQAFKDFAGKFNSDTSIKDIYDIYTKTQPRKEHKSMGSMKQGKDSGVKDYYTPEEIERLTEEDLDDPIVWANVRRSMTGG